MGTTLFGTTPQDTYDSLIKVTDNGPLSGTAKYLSDGLGNDSVLALSTARVGVGTTSPATALHTNGVIRSANAGNTVFTELQNDGVYATATDLYLLAPATKFVSLYAGGAESMRITSAGNVGIGTSAPSSPLTIQPANETPDTFRIYRGKDSGYQFQSAIIDAVSGNVNIKSLASDSARWISFQLSSNSGSTYTQAARIDLDGLKFGSDTLQVNALDDYEEGTFTPTVEGSSTAGTATYSVQDGKYTKIGNQISILIDLAWSGGTGTGVLRIVGLPFTNVAFNSAGTIGFINDIALTASNYATTYVAPSSTRLDFVQSPTGGGSVTDVPYDAAGRLIVSATYFNA